MSQSVDKRLQVQRRIVRLVIRDALAAGYALNVNNGGDTHELPKPSTKAKEVLAALFGTEDDSLLYYKDGKRVGWVRLIYCNSGHEVIADYTTNLEAVLKGANELADKLDT